MSVINLADPWFSLPYDAAAFPFSANTANRGSKATSAQLNSSSVRCQRLNGCTANGSRTTSGDKAAARHGSQLPSQPVSGCSVNGEKVACSGASPLHRQLVSSCSVALGDAHLLSMCAKLVYEDPARIRAVATRQASAGPVARNQICIARAWSRISAAAQLLVTPATLLPPPMTHSQTAARSSFVAASDTTSQFGLHHLACLAARIVFRVAMSLYQALDSWCGKPESCYRWGLQFRAWRCVPTHAAGACGYVPDVIWMALTTPAAVIVAFRGADPFTQVWSLYQWLILVRAVASSCCRHAVDASDPQWLTHCTRQLLFRM